MRGSEDVIRGGAGLGRQPWCLATDTGRLFHSPDGANWELYQYCGGDIFLLTMQLPDVGNLPCRIIQAFTALSCRILRASSTVEMVMHGLEAGELCYCEDVNWVFYGDGYRIKRLSA